MKTRWWEYSQHVLSEDAYKAVERCSAGSRPKDLFEYVIEDMEKEYDAAKVRGGWGRAGCGRGGLREGYAAWMRFPSSAH